MHRENPALAALRYHVSGAIERGKAEAIDGRDPPACPQCGKPNYSWFVGMVCATCTRRNHRAVTRGH
jgi:hypothetical protein